jgi:hypothetical protein
MLCGLLMHGHDSLTLNSLLLLYCFANVLYMLSLFLLLNSFYNTLTRLITICHELLYILSFYLYTVCMILVDAIYQNVTLSKDRSVLHKISVS